MRRFVVGMVFAVVVLCGGVSVAHATGPVFDAANYAINLFRNALLQTQHVREVLDAAMRLTELKNAVQEFRFFNQEIVEAGFREIQGIVNRFRGRQGERELAFLNYGDLFTESYTKVLQNNPYFQGRVSEINQLDTWVAHAESGTTLTYYLNLVPDPFSEDHTYITYEQAEISRSFDQAETLREYATQIAEEGDALSQDAASANLLGATRLQAASMGKLYEIMGMMLISQGRLQELESIALEQYSRQEKLDELARERIIQDLGEFVTAKGGAFSLDL